MAGAEGVEPTYGLINNQVPFQLGYAPKIDVGSAPLRNVLTPREYARLCSVRLLRPEVRFVAFGVLWMVSGRRAFFMAADIKKI